MLGSRNISRWAAALNIKSDSDQMFRARNIWSNLPTYLDLDTSILQVTKKGFSEEKPSAFRARIWGKMKTDAA